MSIKLMSQVWDQAEAEGSKLLLLLALADMANDEGYCWPSYKTLAKKIRVSEHQTISLMNELVADGWIKKEVRYRRDDPTSQTSNGYWIKIPESRGGVTPTSPGGLSVGNPGGLSGGNPNHHIEPSVESEELKKQPPEIETQRPNIYRLYEQELGALTPLISNALDDIEKTYPEGWFEKALVKARKSTTRINLNYLIKIMDGFRDNGLDDRRNGGERLPAESY